MSKLVHIFFLFAVVLIGCVPANEEPKTEVKASLDNPLWQKVYNYRDHHQLDSLLLYTSHPDPSLRYIVADGFASIRSEESIDSLTKLLKDPVMDVRVAAAYALGQLGVSEVSNPLLKAFKSKDTLNIDNKFNSTILEAVGKTGNEYLLKNIATVSTYRNTDTLLLLGQSRAIYRYALRGVTIPEGTDKMVEYITNKEIPAEVRLVAANYLYRAKGLVIDDFKYQLADVMIDDENPNIRMALVSALGKLGDPELFNTLKTQLESETDYRVRCNIIRSLSGYKYIRTIEMVLAQLESDNIHIANTAAQFLIDNGISNDAVVYRNYLNDDRPYSVNAKIYSAVLKHIPVFYTNTKSIIKNEILEKYNQATDNYVKAAYLKSLGYDPYNYKEIATLLIETNSPILKTAGMEALGTLLRSDNFVRAHKRRSNFAKGEIIELIKDEIKAGDIGAIAVAGDIISDTNIGLKELIDSSQFLTLAMNKLELPKEIESYNSLKKALDYLNGVEHKPTTPNYNHKIPFNIYSIYGDSVAAAIKTDRGVIRLELYSDVAPGTVANFVSLSDSKFYNGKVFHRVVPNFVVQAGCPRGDGYGSLDYAIRSEVSQLYYDSEGYIGMASAGPDTEGTQWFITHSPAMHLDGKYTIFGKVTEGMDVVHSIEVGDKIQEVIITKR